MNTDALLLGAVCLLVVQLAVLIAIALSCKRRFKRYDQAFDTLNRRVTTLERLERGPVSSVRSNIR